MSSMDAEAEMEGLFGGEDQGQEEGAQTQSLTQEGLFQFMMYKINGPSKSYKSVSAAFHRRQKSQKLKVSTCIWSAFHRGRSSRFLRLDVSSSVVIN